MHNSEFLTGYRDLSLLRTNKKQLHLTDFDNQITTVYVKKIHIFFLFNDFYFSHEIIRFLRES